MTALDEIEQTFEFAFLEFKDDGRPRPLRDALAVACRAFAGSATAPIERKPTQIVLRSACDEFEVSMEDLLGGSRRGCLPLVRRISVWLLKASGMSYQQAAEALGRASHTDAMSACRTVNRSKRDQAEAAKVCRRIAAQLPSVRLAPVIYPRARVA
jgi:chromosomal replication initiation ATPase DnaA